LTKTSAPRDCCAERPLRRTARAVEDSRLPPCPQHRRTRVVHPALGHNTEKRAAKYPPRHFCIFVFNTLTAKYS
jgi:hypothetical protein